MTKPKSGRFPWMKWWPSRWRGDPAVQACSLAARGAWHEILNVMQQEDSDGVLLIGGEPPDAETIARLLGCTEREWKAAEAELDKRRVWSRRESDGAIYCRSTVRDSVPVGVPEGSPEESQPGTPREPEGRPPSRALSPLSSSSSSSSGGGRGGGRKREASEAEIDAAFRAVPALDRPECRTAWAQWTIHRREIGKPVTPSSASAAIAGYAKRGPAPFVAAISHTIAKGWQGLRDPEPDSLRNGNDRPLTSAEVPSSGLLEMPRTKRWGS